MDEERPSVQLLVKIIYGKRLVLQKLNSKANCPIYVMEVLTDLSRILLVSKFRAIGRGRNVPEDSILSGAVFLESNLGPSFRLYISCISCERMKIEWKQRIEYY